MEHYLGKVLLVSYSASQTILQVVLSLALMMYLVFQVSMLMLMVLYNLQPMAVTLGLESQTQHKNFTLMEI